MQMLVEGLLILIEQIYTEAPCSKITNHFRNNL
jgi:hypothetical protein